MIGILCDLPFKFLLFSAKIESVARRKKK